MINFYQTEAMALDFLSCESRIELNKERLNKYDEGLEKATGRISLISIIYSLLSIYLIQMIKFTMVHRFESPLFLIFLGLLIICIAISVVWTIRLLLPVNVAHLHEPKYFYTELKKYYEGKGTPKEQLGDKIARSYLHELEQASENNYKVYCAKRRNFYYAFNFALIALIPYLICAALMLSKKENNEPQKMEISNSTILLQQIDSLISKHK